MHSSISNSDDAIARQAIWRLLMLITILALGVELVTRYGLPLVNQNMRRFHEEYSRAVQLDGSSTDGSMSVLLLGNSLTYTDIDLNIFGEELGPGCKVVRWAIDDTNYLDWYFGLRRLFRAGGRPRYVVLGATSNHLLSTRVRGHFFAHYILDGQDLFKAANRTSANATGFSEMSLAQTSAFYGSREELYKRVMTLILPHFDSFARSLTRRPASDRMTIDVSRRALDRLTELNNLCRAHGAQLVVWLPPTRYLDSHLSNILTAARQCDVPALVPVAHQEFSDDLFRDPIHLKAASAQLFTPRLAAQLRPLITPANKPTAGSP